MDVVAIRMRQFYRALINKTSRAMDEVELSGLKLLPSFA